MKVHTTWSLLFACLLVPALASGASVTINDLADSLLFTATGFDPASLSIQNLLEQFDLHGEYLSNSPLPPGIVAVANFNFLEPSFEGGGLSDTLSITITGHTPTANDLNNINVDLHFCSDPEAGTALPPLANAFSITETGALQDLSALIGQVGGPSDLSVSVVSDVVPEPATWGLMLIGTAGIVLGKLRRRR